MAKTKRKEWEKITFRLRGYNECHLLAQVTLSLTLAVLWMDQPVRPSHAATNSREIHP